MNNLWIYVTIDMKSIQTSYILIHFTLKKDDRNIIESSKSNQPCKKWGNAYMNVSLLLYFIDFLFYFIFGAMF